MVSVLPAMREQGAVFSGDGQHRFRLWRTWNREQPVMLVCGLNPSKAGAQENDATIIRCVTLAMREGCGGLIMVNLSSYISTDPDGLFEPTKNGKDAGRQLRSDLWRPETDAHLRRAADLSPLHVVAWGAGGQLLPERVEHVLGMLWQPWCLGVTKDGHPRHPVRLANSVELVPLPGTR